MNRSWASMEAFEAFVEQGGIVEVDDDMPDDYRRAVFAFIEMHANSELMGGLTELSTAVHLGLDLIVVVYNDGSYGAEHIQLVTKGMDPAASLHEWPDFCAVAESMGCDTVKISSLDDIDAALEVVKNRQPGRPVLIEASTDPDVVSAIYGHHR